MKVTETRNQISDLLQQQQAGEKTAQSRETRPVSGTVVTEEKVTLSGRAKEVQQARQIIAGLPDVRKDKVADLKARIDDGSYQVDGEKIAEKMIGESLLDILA